MSSIRRVLLTVSTVLWAATLLLTDLASLPVPDQVHRVFVGLSSALLAATIVVWAVSLAACEIQATVAQRNRGLEQLMEACREEGRDEIRRCNRTRPIVLSDR